MDAYGSSRLPSIISSLSLYSQKLKEKESTRAQVFEILKVSLKNQKERSFKEPRPPTRQDTQAHGEVPQPDDPAQSVVTSAQDPYTQRGRCFNSLLKRPLC